MLHYTVTSVRWNSNFWYFWCCSWNIQPFSLKQIQVSSSLVLVEYRVFKTIISEDVAEYNSIAADRQCHRISVLSYLIYITYHESDTENNGGAPQAEDGGLSTQWLSCGYSYWAVDMVYKAGWKLQFCKKYTIRLADHPTSQILFIQVQACRYSLGLCMLDCVGDGFNMSTTILALF